MSLFRLLIGWALVAIWFLLWDLARRRFRKNGTHPDLPASRWPALRARLTLPLIEALLLTLFASLWFASLGHGGWLLLFLLIGLLIELPVRLRDGHWTMPPPWPRLAGGVVRIVVAGGVLAWRLG